MNKEIVKQIFPEAVKKVEIGECPFCGKKVYLDNFRDDLSLSEFRISGMCQSCIDEVFKEK